MCVTWEPVASHTMDHPDASWVPGPSSCEVVGSCPMLCRREPHHCWYVDMGMDMAALIRRWLAQPVLDDGGQLNVLDELVQSQVPERSLHEVVAEGLAQIRQSLEQSVVVSASTNRANNDILEYSNESTQSVRQIRTRSVGVQTEVRRRHDVVPLMSIRCRRPRQGLLGSGPVSITRIQQHGRSQLRQSRH